MGPLPADFAETLARVLEPSHRRDAARVIEAAASLDDEGLRIFLDLFAARVRSSSAPVRRDELEKFLQAAVGGSAGAP